MKKNITLASIGDLCMDHYTNSNAGYLGGTAFNVAANANKIGVKTGIFSAIGTDENGKHFKDYFIKNGIDAKGLSEIEGRTSSVDVTLDETASPTYTNWDLGVLGKYTLTKQHEKLLQTYDIARITYLKPISHLLNAFSTFNLPQTLKAADFAGESLYSANVSVVSSYITNLDVIIKSLNESDHKELDYLKSLSNKFPDKYFLILMGKSGSIVYNKSETFHQHPILPEQIIDTNGAGDSYVASFLVTFLQFRNIQQAMYEGATAQVKQSSTSER